MTVGVHIISECLFQSPKQASLFAMLRSTAPDAASLREQAFESEFSWLFLEFVHLIFYFSDAVPAVWALQIISCVCNNSIGTRDASADAPPGVRTSSGSVNAPALRSSVSKVIASLRSSAAKVSGGMGGLHVRPTTFAGNPSEVALANFFESFCDGNVEKIRNMYPAVFQINFNSRNKYAAAVIKVSRTCFVFGSCGVLLTNERTGELEWSRPWPHSVHCVGERCSRGDCRALHNALT